uniref:Uncharacterized protein n=1 Tax=Vannella robusta TaxID=1487602 RepID=A0A7S4IIT5_9EUKA|mmetsp:Transcript_3125/g.3840  ORF Transcript_3125/g.3840 Transcript_3125/m.3840 type:complete len:211 (+) Transcript_3125:34-666(+)
MSEANIAKLIAANKPVRIVIAGKLGVGKTCLLKTLADGEFPKEELPSVEESFNCSIQVRGHSVPLFLQDTMGQEAFRKITQSFYQGCQAILICYDVSDKESFTLVPSWMKEIKSYCLTDKSKHVPIILVGNKCDIVEGKAVTFGEGEQFAKSENIPFFETSALQDVNVVDPFECIVEQIADGPVVTRKTPQEMMNDLDVVPAKKKTCTLL